MKILNSELTLRSEDEMMIQAGIVPWIERLDTLADGLSHNPLLVSFLQVLTLLGTTIGVIILTTLAIAGLWFWSRKRESVVLALAILTSWQLVRNLKILIARPRPSGEWLTFATGFSFPSGHAMMCTVLFGFLIYLILVEVKHPIWRIGGSLLLTLLILLIGFSRIYLGVHYISDVLAGFLLGLICLGIFILILKALKRWETGMKADTNER